MFGRVDFVPFALRITGRNDKARCGLADSLERFI
jgi:hypothetical protein